MIKFLNKIKDFLLCLLMAHCQYSIKKFLSYLFSALVVYVVVFTDKDYLELLVFIAALLGMRSYERLKSGEDKNVVNTNKG